MNRLCLKSKWFHHTLYRQCSMHFHITNTSTIWIRRCF
nr:MAG TPA: hypothetical protein [Caudoviricetes sp.]